MNCSVCIRSPHGQRWFLPQASKKIKSIEDAISESCEPVNFLFSAVIPTRTKGLNYFIKDFFFPTLINRVLALKINSFAIRFLTCLFAFLFDCLTFPARLFTSLPKALKDSKKEDHPLKKYLLQEKAPSNLLKSDVLQVKITLIEDRKVVETSSRNKITGVNETIFEFVQKKSSLRKEIFLMEMPFERAEDVSKEIEIPGF